MLSPGPVLQCCVDAKHFDRLHGQETPRPSELKPPYSTEKIRVNDVACFFLQWFHHGRKSRTWVHGLTDNVIASAAFELRKRAWDTILTHPKKRNENAELHEGPCVMECVHSDTPFLPRFPPLFGERRRASTWEGARKRHADRARIASIVAAAWPLPERSVT